MDADTERAIADFLRGIQRRDTIPGISVAVVDAADPVTHPSDDPAAYADGFGARDLAGNRPATADTLYGVGSVTQPITATAVLQLSASGLLDLDDPVTDHLDLDLGRDAVETDAESDGEAAAGNDAEPEPIRLRHLLAHTSGLPTLGLREALLARRLRIGTDTVPLSDWADVRAYIEDGATERLAPPGERFARCDAGYVLLGRVIEECTGRSFAEAVTEHLFDPLGLDRATFDDTEFSLDDDHMTQYLQEEGEPTAASLPTADLTRSATGLLASVRHLGAFLWLQLNEGTYAGREVIDGECLASAHDTRRETPHGGVRYGSHGGVGYGWRTRTVCDRELVGIAGDIAVSSAYMGFAPAEGVGVAVAANTAPDYSLAALGHGVFACVLGENPYDTVPSLARRRRFARLTGEYVSHTGGRRATVCRDGGTLRIEYESALGVDGEPLVPDPEGGPYEFSTLDDSGGRHAVVFDPERDPTTVVVDGWRFRRVSALPE
jgi:CubicO group peptidase (beta-lactamase class C family)